jgi:hypothetical protein
MAFRLNNILLVPRPTYKELPVVSGLAITFGDVLRIVNGEWDLCATNEIPAGVSMTPGTVTGTADNSVTVQGVLTYGCIFEVPQGVNTDANTQVGDTLDINATSDGVTTTSNADFKVYAHDRDKNLLYGFFSIGNGAVFPI